ncbi:MAG: InlB B-repeat-containing protein [Bacteroidetes bacterium]|nr:InlB B-repeat-containing protein [Bacteroidota bacterium]
MQRLVFNNLALAATVIGIVATTSCKKASGEDDRTFTVTFNSKGGGEVATQTVKIGDRATEPEPAPALAGYILEGWYTDDFTLKNRWNFAANTIITNITLYAKWELSQLLHETISYTRQGTSVIYNCFSLTITKDEQFTINWGDGSDIQTITGPGDGWYSHFYDDRNISHNVIISGGTADCSFTYFNCVDLDSFGTDWQMMHLDLMGCKSLQNLICYGNWLKNLDLSECTALTTLDCEWNQLTTIDLSSNNALSYINCNNNRFLLSELYNISKKISNPNNKVLGTQRLEKREIAIGDIIDYSAQNEFDGIATVFIVYKDDSPALSNDYTINNGIMTFSNTGNYTITMSNAAILSHSFYPAEVIVNIRVN